MEKHAQPVDSAKAPFGSLSKQWRDKRHVDDVGDDRAVRQSGEIDRRTFIAVHAERGGVDKKRGVGKQLGNGIPAMGARATPKAVHQGLRTGERAVDNPDVAEAARLKRMHDGKGGAPRPKHGGNAPVPSGQGRIEIRRKAVGVRIASVQAPLLKPERVDGADRLGCFIEAFCQAVGGLLVRYGDIAARVALFSYSGEEGGEVRRENVPALICALDAIFPKPIAVNERRTRMCDWMSTDESAWMLSHRWLRPF